MALNLRLSLTISGLLNDIPRSSNLAFIASSLSNISFGTFSGPAAWRRPMRASLRRWTAKIKCLEMTYRKFKADYLFTGFELAAPDAVLIAAGDGTVQAIVSAAEAGEDVETHRG